MMPECDCHIPELEGMGQHSPGCAIFRDDPPPSFTCPRCARVSYNPTDIKEGYCGNCHDWTGKFDPWTALSYADALDALGPAEP